MGDRRHGGTDLYLVEVRSCPPSVDDAVRMHAALRDAVTRLGSAGTAIRWCAAWLLPDQHRCLCLLQADRESDVVLARDLAALTSASVTPARALGGAPLPPSGRRS
ncbi:hypothetical protein [Geodermatophilus sp. CPCC 206100]|uniref:hypothetical protein n=1 Tax=Geodermatophilus sp. CPCC 206100 TaxID=3020054 RepID=UPI003B00775C